MANRGFVLIVSLFGALGLAGLPAQTKAQGVTSKVDPHKVQETLDVCFGCHGSKGVSTSGAFPTIAGQDSAYLLNQLTTFRRTSHGAPATQDAAQFATVRRGLPGRSSNEMAEVVKGMDDDLIVAVVKVLTDLPCDGKPRQRAQRMETLPPPAQVKRCTVCHGADGVGLRPGVPRLAGQQRAYLLRQLKMLRNSARSKPHPPGEAWRSSRIMNTQALRLSDADIDAIAHHYSELNCHGNVGG